MKDSIWMLLRARIKKPLCADSISASCRLGYMGSHEFEDGVMPASLRRLRAMNLSLHTVPGVTHNDGRPLLCLGEFSDAADRDHYFEMLKAVSEERHRLLESSFLKQSMRREEDLILPQRRLTKRQREDFIRGERAVMFDLWWDVLGDTFMSFDAEYMAILPQALDGSWAIMKLPAPLPIAS